MHYLDEDCYSCPRHGKRHIAFYDGVAKCTYNPCNASLNYDKQRHQENMAYNNMRKKYPPHSEKLWQSWEKQKQILDEAADILLDIEEENRCFNGKRSHSRIKALDKKHIQKGEEYKKQLEKTKKLISIVDKIHTSNDRHSSTGGGRSLTWKKVIFWIFLIGISVFTLGIPLILYMVFILIRRIFRK